MPPAHLLPLPRYLKSTPTVKLIWRELGLRPTLVLPGNLILSTSREFSCLWIDSTRSQLITTFPILYVHRVLNHTRRLPVIPDKILFTIMMLKLLYFSSKQPSVIKIVRRFYINANGGRCYLVSFCHFILRHLPQTVKFFWLLSDRKLHLETRLTKQDDIYRLWFPYKFVMRWTDHLEPSPNHYQIRWTRYLRMSRTVTFKPV